MRQKQWLSVVYAGNLDNKLVELIVGVALLLWHILTPPSDPLKIICVEISLPFANAELELLDNFLTDPGDKPINKEMGQNRFAHADRSLKLNETVLKTSLCK